MIGNQEAVRDKGLTPWNEDKTTAAAAEPLVADPVLLTRWVILADSANGGPVLLGGAASQTFPLAPGASIDGTYLGHDPSLVYAAGGAGLVLHLAGCE